VRTVVKKVHKKGRGRTGTMAELHDDLTKQGFAYHYRKDKPYSEVGEMIYKKGKQQAVLKRIQLGRPPKAVSIKISPMLTQVRQRATPDVWQLVTGKRK
jgi:hypothetical protein